MSLRPVPPEPPAPPVRARPTLGALCRGFLLIGAIGFGGVMPWARWLIVERRGWLDPAEFTDMLALAQFLPGPNVGNLAVVLGARFHGGRGAAVSLLALFALPAACVVLLGALYDRFAANLIVARALSGLAAAASGLVVATAIKIALPVYARGWTSVAVAVVTLAVVVLAAAAAVLGAAGDGAGQRRRRGMARAAMSGQVAATAVVFGELSLQAVGGINSTLPEMQRQVVAVRHWMSAEQFAALFALAQAAPGPNGIVATLVGWHVAGWAGAAVATAALIGPTALLAYGVAGTWHRFRAARWRKILQAGLTPVTVGLVLAAAAVLSQSTSHGAGTALVTATTAALLLTTRLHPLLLLAGGAALGALGLA
jgi:chromate transporter